MRKPDKQESNVRGEFKEVRDELRASLRELELKIAALTENKSNTTSNMINTEVPQSKDSFPYKCFNLGTTGHRQEIMLLRKG